MVEGLSHVTFVVSDLDAMTEILTTILDAKEVYSSGGATHSISAEKFFIIGNTWVAIMEGEALPERSYNHVAFKVTDADFDMYADRIRGLGLELRESRPRVPGEGRSLYFHDHDNHLFELHTGTLAQRLMAYADLDM